MDASSDRTVVAYAENGWIDEVVGFNVTEFGGDGWKYSGGVLATAWRDGGRDGAFFVIRRGDEARLLLHWRVHYNGRIYFVEHDFVKWLALNNIHINATDVSV